MSFPSKTPKHIKLDESNHVEKPLVNQLRRLDWKIIDLMDMKQVPADTHQESFTEVVMLSVLR
ncbi:MAG: hypothetical protein OXF73_07050 [Gammaproteobacteria bacterium]|nr:hypothetical protein [Gammaproteobacteria bacterium]MCY4226616.1 hypothetical protein [Gammaproteobacteria bacterium]